MIVCLEELVWLLVEIMLGLWEYYDMFVDGVDGLVIYMVLGYNKKQVLFFSKV